MPNLVQSPGYVSAHKGFMVFGHAPELLHYLLPLFEFQFPGQPGEAAHPLQVFTRVRFVQ